VLRRIEPDETGALVAPREGAYAEPIVPAVAQSDLESSSLPPDHPRWVKDAVAVSQRARDLIAQLKPIALRVLGFWDHRVRSILVGDRRVHVDPSGSYRIGD
jgi:hypothetical protein